VPSTAVPGPLVVVDGTITHYSSPNISQQDIERVEVVKGAAASSLYGSNPRTGCPDLHQARRQLPDGKLAVTVRNEYGQSFRPKLIPSPRAPYLTADSAYTDASGSAVLKGISSTATGQLVCVGGVPSPKPEQIADVPYSAYPHPVNFDVQGDLLNHGPFYTNYGLDRAAARQLELQLFGREHQAKRASCAAQRLQPAELRVNLDQR